MWSTTETGLRKSINNLLQDVWLDLFEKQRGDKEPNLESPFTFAGPAVMGTSFNNSITVTEGLTVCIEELIRKRVLPNRAMQPTRYIRD